MRCSKCSLSAGATNVKVASSGSDNPLVLFIGEYPNRYEDKVGQCFSGKMLEDFNRFLIPSGLKQECCRWTTLVKCIPWSEDGQSTRTPSEVEIQSCRSYTEAEILTTNPVFIVTLGNTALHSFLPKAPVISKARKKRYFIELPSINYVYRKAVNWARISGFDLDDPSSPLYLPMVPDERSINKFIKNAEGYGFSKIERKTFTVYPTFSPAAAYRGNKEAELGLIEDLSYIKYQIEGDTNKVEYELLTEVEDIKTKCEYIKSLYNSGEVKFITTDVETNSLDPYDKNSKILLLSISWDKGKAISIPLDHQYSIFCGDKLSRLAIVSILNDLYSVVPVVNHNIKFDLKFLLTYGIKVQIIGGDTYLASWTLFNDTIHEHGLEALATRYAGMINHKEEMTQALSDAIAVDENGVVRNPTMDDIDIDLVHRYCCADADSTFRLHCIFNDMMESSQLKSAHERICVPAILPITMMEHNGIYLDIDLLNKTKDEYELRLKSYYEKIDGYGFKDQILENINTGKKKPVTEYKLTAPAVKKAIIFDILGFTPREYGKTGPSVDKATVNSCVEECLQYIGTDSDVGGYYTKRLDVLKTIRDFNSDNKMFTSYIRPIPEYADSNNVIHTNYGIRTTDTGRCNCRDPSLHVIPWKSVIKKAFKSIHKSGLILSADYSQAELRVLASLCEDEILIDAFVQGKDIHRMIASIVLHKAPEEILDAERRRIKTIVFGLCFGRGPESIAEQENITIEEAKALIKNFYKMFPRINEWVKAQHEFGIKYRQVWSPHGFRRLFDPDMDDQKIARRSVNTPIQGGASDIALIALTYINNLLSKSYYKSTLFSFIHDSVGFSVFPGELYDMCEVAKRCMVEKTSSYLEWMKAPLKIDFEVGTSWGELTKAEMLPNRQVKFEECKPEYYNSLFECMDSWIIKPKLVSYEEKERLEDGSEMFQSLSATAVREAQKVKTVDAVFEFPII